jgi:hypothetical protein
MAFLLKSQQDRLETVKATLFHLGSADPPAVQDIPAVTYPRLPGNKSGSGRL